METVNGEIYTPMNIICSVKDVVFKTNQIGIVNPIVLLHQNKELQDADVNAVVFRRRQDLVDLGLGKNSRIKLHLDENKVPSISLMIKKNQTPSAPTHCGSCDHHLTEITDSESGEKDTICTNRFCSASARGFIYKLIFLSSPVPPRIESIDLYLNKFVIAEDTNSIDSFTEFKLVTSMQKHWHTQARLNQWVKVHGEIIGTELFDIENSIQKFVRGGKNLKSYFWSICNFPEIDEETFNAISKIPPKDFLYHASFNNSHQWKNLPARAKKLLNVNIPFIALLYKLFDEMGEPTEWMD